MSDPKPPDPKPKPPPAKPPDNRPPNKPPGGPPNPRPPKGAPMTPDEYGRMLARQAPPATTEQLERSARIVASWLLELRHTA